MNALGYLSVTPKGRQKMLLRDAKESQLYDYQVKVNQAKVEKSQRKFDLALYKQEKNLQYKDLAEKRKIDEKLKAKYGLSKTKTKKGVNSFNAFKKFNSGISKSKIIPRYTQPIVNQSLPNFKQNDRWNPFAHRDPVEVYGDDGLTLFDGDKRADDDTGSLFGLHKRRLL